MKVNGLNQLSGVVEYETIVETHEKKAKKVLVSNRVKELLSQGIDKELAKVMANIEYNYNL